MNATIFQRFFWGDYLRDTMHLSTEEHGAYLLLIAAYWTRGRAPADDDRQLAAITRLSLKKWIKVRPKVAEFFDISEGHFFHKRIESDLQKAREHAEKQRENGRRGGRPRKPKQNPPLSFGETQTITQTKAHHSHSHKKKEAPAPSGAAASCAAPLPTNEPERSAEPVERPPDPPPKAPAVRPEHRQAVEACFAAAGPGLADPSKTPSLHTSAGRIVAALEAGCDLEADLLPVIRARTAAPRASPVRAWGYFEAAWLDARNERLRPLSPPHQPASNISAIPSIGQRHDFAEPRTYAQLERERWRNAWRQVREEFGIAEPKPELVAATLIG